MSLKQEGIWPCKVLDGRYGEDDKRAAIVVINVEITDGPDKGKRCSYEDRIDMKSGKYIALSMRAIGWTGNNPKTLEDDIEAWIERTGGMSTVEVVHLEIKKGKKYDAWVDNGMSGPRPMWDKVKSIGRQGTVVKPASVETTRDAMEALASSSDTDSNYDPDVDNRYGTTTPTGGNDIPF